MGIEVILDYFSQYGIIFLFVIVFLEYLNLPGLPAGIIMPAAGVLISNSEMNFIAAIIISVLAGLLGSWTLYAVGRFGGNPLLEKYIKKFPKHKNLIEKNIEFMNKKGDMGIFIGKLIPMVRTLISIPAGLAKMNFVKFSIYSTLGIFLWNTAFITFGYVLGDKFLKIAS